MCVVGFFFSLSGLKTTLDLGCCCPWSSDNLFYLYFYLNSCYQDLMSLSHFGGFLFYPNSSFLATSAYYLNAQGQSGLDFRGCPSIRSRDYFSSPAIFSFVPAASGNFKYLTPDWLTWPKMEEKTEQEVTGARISKEQWESTDLWGSSAAC